MGNVKNVIKKGLSKAFSISIEDLEAKTEYVSFDIFDTLVLRNCEKPSDVFRIVGSNIDGFYEARVQAEKEVRHASRFEEITLNEIYEHLRSVYGTDKADQLKQKEIETEITICVPNHEVVEKYNEMVAQGRSVFLISDMYLPKAVIQSILNKCGIGGYKKLYVSSEYRKTKRSGKLFDLVLKENAISNNRLTHIGDNPVSDWFVPKEKSIASFLYGKRRSYTFLRPIRQRLAVSVTPKMKKEFDALQITCGNSMREYSAAYEAGNTVLGPMLYGFTCWLHKRVVDHNVQKLVFLSREGRILKESYELLYGDESATLIYINVSRLALCRARIIETSSWQELLDLMASLLKNIDTVDEFVDLLGIKGREHEICTFVGCSTSRFDEYRLQ